ncbi:MAG: CinA family nicotinamide mononucleotide deamidase-related protein [Phycisphaerales bacterium]|nr:CinA family nicotinamide mononucleotide deamidase-related protein [Phycisphaerae bacterium]NNF42054.1 CinA family nicotinamide mononucleotide deamidase-related protein [Phycisphaerales bacterium]NNM25121.1 CinA family nicotinamide mononucleotide deamidase-related protein [Phycisphaerales bacterium]
MQAAVLSIGDELVLGARVDTNSAWLSAELAAVSIVVDEHRTVDDDRGAIARAIAALAERHDVLLTTGGLGPTADDLTRDALRDVVDPGVPLEEDAETAARLRRFFARSARSMPASNLVQARRPPSMRCLPNPHGTAPGLAGTCDGCLIFALPGPPREMRPMFRDHVLPTLPAAAADRQVKTATVNSFGLAEAAAAERLGDRMTRDRNPTIGTTASSGIITARIRAVGTAAEAATLAEEACGAVEAAWQPYAFGRGDETLAAAVARLLQSRGQTLVTAESCTGGALGAMIVDEPGASGHYRGGWVTYHNDLKTAALGVPGDRLATHGAVSKPVAEAMATGARTRGDADWAVAITGVAGPGAEAEAGGPKPPGLVWIAVAGPDTLTARRFRFRGERGLVRDRSAKAALQMLRLALRHEDVTLLWEDAAGSVES